MQKTPYFSALFAGNLNPEFIMNDPIGRAIADYFEMGEAPDIQINTTYTIGETMAPSVFFRSEEELPQIEAEALRLCRGKVLDVGAAAGRHALALQNRGLEVTALEQSKIAAEVMQKRGVKNVVCDDVFHFNEKGFDTIIILMNGAGIGQTLKGAKKLLLHLKTLLNPHGQMLMDSSDIRYLFEEDDGSMWIDMASKTYLGEMEYEVTYKDSFSRFKWLFIDYDTLSDIAREAGLVPDLITQGEHYDYLARLTFPD